MEKGYVTFTSSGIHVDLERFLRTESGKKLIRDVAKASERFVKKEQSKAAPPKDGE